MSVIFSSGRWAALSQAGTQVIKLLVSLVLARLLDPGDFGLMAMAMIVVGFTDLFKELGTVPAIVQRKETSDELLSSLFFFNIVLGLVTSAAVFLATPLLARIYADPALEPLLKALAWILFISSFGLLKKALLQKQMRFNVLARVELSAALVQGVVAVVLGALGWKVWALVIGSIAAAVVSTILFWFSLSWRPQLVFRWSEVKKVFHFSLNLTGSQVLGYFISNTDSVIVGRFLGASPLGFYGMVQRLLSMPIQFLTGVSGRVLFPALAAEQDNHQRIREVYLRVCALIALITFPLLAGALGVARPLVLAVFGQKWAPIIGLIQVLAPAFMVQSIAMTVGVIYMVKGRADWQLWWQAAAGAAVIAGVWVGLKWGIVGVACGYSAAIILLTYPAFAIPFRLVGLRFGELIVALRPYAIATALMLLIVLGGRLACGAFHLRPYVELPVCVLLGALSYAASLLALNPPGIEDLRKLVLPMLPAFGKKRTPAPLPASELVDL